MVEYLQSINFFNFSKFGVALESINDAVLDLYNKNGNKNKDKYEINGQNFSYVITKDRYFQIKYNNIVYKIEKEPFIFYNEKKEILGKLYDYESFENRVKYLPNEFNIYNFDNIELKTESDILNNESRKFILKKNILFSIKNFELLNAKKEFNSSQIFPIKIFKSELSPIPQKEFYNKEEDITLVLENRNELITYINEFMDSWKERILIIYGCDGIGKSATFIYLSNLFNKYKVLYFNLKIIMSNKEESYNLFTFEIMRYFTVNRKYSDMEEVNKINYQDYLDYIKNIKKEDFNFGEELIKFIKYKQCNYETLLIIDQYKNNYDDKLNLSLIQLKNIILSKVTTFKLLICLSVNNTNTKNNFIELLNYCSANSPSIIISEENKSINNEDIYENMFYNINLENNSNYGLNQDDGEFERVSLFKLQEDNNCYKNIINKKTDVNNKQINENNIKNRNILENKNQIINDNFSEINKIKSIYINELISIKKIDDNDITKYLEVFDYNPKYYIKFKNFLLDNVGSLDDLYNKFLDNIFQHISNKIAKYYEGRSNDILRNETIIELIKLKDLVDNKVKFTAPILIKLIKEFPIKYIKVKIYEKDNNNKANNIINLNNKFMDTEFYFQFCFPFFDIILSKLIYMNDNIYSINYSQLTGSAKGSFLEQKIKRAIIMEDCFYQKINLRYVWNFNSSINEIPKNINEYDYINYNKIDFDENKKKIDLSNFTYYIIPYSQTNRNIDSALLIPEEINNEKKKFKLVLFQIKQGNDIKIKTKKEYINSSFLTKRKFEELYNIEISNIYFYFVLPKEFKTNENIFNNLKNDNISYLFFSISEHYFYENDKIMLLKNLINPYSEIFEIDDNYEEENLINKLKIINKLEGCLKMKRFFGSKITRNSYENGRKIFYKKDKGLRMTNIQRKSIINLLKKNFAIEYNFTIKYIFFAKIEEYLSLISHEDLFGIFFYKSNYYIMHKIYIFSIDAVLGKNKNNININNVYEFINKLNEKDKRSLRFKLPDESIPLEQINNERYIYAFKIYPIE